MTKADTPRASVPSTRGRTSAAKPKRTSAAANSKPETLASVADIMRALGRQAREAARELALAPTDAKNAALRAAAREIRAQTATILAENGRDLAAATADARHGGLPRPPRPRSQAHRGHGQGPGGDRRPARSRRHGDRPVDAAERAAHRARARAARRHRHRLREPAQRDGRRRRAVPQGRQRRDPARRLG